VKYQRRNSADEAKTETGQFEMKESIFDHNGGMYGILLVALPLKEGFRARFPVSRRITTKSIGSP